MKSLEIAYYNGAEYQNLVWGLKIAMDKVSDSHYQGRLLKDCSGDSMNSIHPHPPGQKSEKICQPKNGSWFPTDRTGQ
jgi:hypothetical protein